MCNDSHTIRKSSLGINPLIHGQDKIRKMYVIESIRNVVWIKQRLLDHQ